MGSGEQRRDQHPCRRTGLFYDNMRTLVNFGELTWPQAKPITIQNPSFPDPFGGRSRETFLSNDAADRHRRQQRRRSTCTRTSSTSASNRMLTRDLALTADFTDVYRYGDRDTVEINIPDQTTRQRPYPPFVRVNFWQPTADNTYRALLLKVEKRMSSHYQALVSYTLSKAEDDSFTSALGGSVRLFEGASGQASPIAAIASWSAASSRCRARCRCRRLAISGRACRSARSRRAST